MNVGILLLNDERLYSLAEVRELDRLAIEDHGIPGLVLMRRAARQVVASLLAEWPTAKSVAVYCGSGNNAGDGYIVAGMLADRGMAVRVVSVGDPDRLGADAAQAFEYCREGTAVFTDEALDCDVVVDALLGTGLTGNVRPVYDTAIGQINASGAPVLAVDVPSGLSADTGNILGRAVQAQLTVTFIGLKRGLYTGDGPGHSGSIVYSDLDVPSDIFARVGSSVHRLSLNECQSRLPKRDRNSHKTSYGHVLVVGGDDGMGGAVLMAAEAALRVGAGLVSVATRRANIVPLLARRPEVMARAIDHVEDIDALLDHSSCVVAGPGLGRSDWSRSLFDRLLKCGKPGVLDADALNLLAEAPRQVVGKGDWILTPHPGEAARLLGGKQWLDDRFAAVAEIQKCYGGVVLLKGAGTLVSDGADISLCPYGNPGMATAGMGDVLSGVIGGLVAQGLAAYEAARIGAVIHACAGDHVARQHGERGLLATDVMPAIRKLVG